jgi:hypothetical protein
VHGRAGNPPRNIGVGIDEHQQVTLSLRRSRVAGCRNLPIIDRHDAAIAEMEEVVRIVNLRQPLRLPTLPAQLPSFSQGLA